MYCSIDFTLSEVFKAFVYRYEKIFFLNFIFFRLYLYVQLLISVVPVVRSGCGLERSAPTGLGCM